MLLVARNRCRSQSGRHKLLSSSWDAVVSVVKSGKREWGRSKERRRHGECDRRNKSSRETREWQA